MYYGDSFADLATMRLEGKIKGIYAQAYREIEEKLNTFLAKSVIKEKEYEAKVQAGKLSQEWFDRWKSGQVFIGKRWRDLRQNIAHEIYNSRKSATDMINGERKAVFQDNVNYTQYSIDKDHNFGISFTLYDNATVTRLINEDPDLVPDVKYPDPSIDYAWSKKQITSAITQGILQGESIPKLAMRIGKKLESSNTASMVRCARTAMTGAQNSGRIQAMHNAQDMGIQVQKLWISTLDGRTRDSHRDLDGQLADVDKPFNSILGEIMFPGDPNASPANTWNCRCTLGWEYSKYRNQYDTRAARDFDWEEGGQTEQIQYMTFNEWLKWIQNGKPEIPKKQKYITAWGWGIDKPLKIIHDDDVIDVKISVVDDFDYPDGTTSGSYKKGKMDCYELPDGMKIYYQSDMNIDEQGLSPVDLINAYLKLPEHYRAIMQKQIEVVDYRNPQDKNWEKKYNMPNFRSYMVGGESITVWGYKHHDHDQLLASLVHEGGHFIDYMQKNKVIKPTGPDDMEYYSTIRISETKKWESAMKRDLKKYGMRSYTSYGAVANIEDFAESCKGYITNHDYFATYFPARTRILDKVIGNGKKKGK